MKPINRAELKRLVNNWKVLGIVLNDVDTSLITDMSCVFYNMFDFNEPLDKWNTKNVTKMNGMFNMAKSFNQPLNWDTGKVTNVDFMFCGAESFNQPLDWDTGNVTKMKCMFFGAKSFNQSLDFNTRNVINMGWMFYDAKLFNQPLDWDTGSVRNMSNMFMNAISFNQNLFNKKREKWAFVETQYVKKVNKIKIRCLPTHLIRYIAEFAFSSWDMKNVKKGEDMFKGASSYTY